MNPSQSLDHNIAAMAILEAKNQIAAEGAQLREIVDHLARMRVPAAYRGADRRTQIRVNAARDALDAATRSIDAACESLNDAGEVWSYADLV
ncbi:MAG TPA: hypothetical protein VFA43_04090 [Gemmatimonadaceae bacterium]|nr:hypothetical protein [Gemmatimonadaceae bacterium]